MSADEDRTRRKVIKGILLKWYIVYVPTIAAWLSGWLGSLAIGVDEWTELLCASGGLVATVLAIIIYKREKANKQETAVKLKENSDEIGKLRTNGIQKDNDMVSMACTTKEVADLIQVECNKLEKKLRSDFEATIDEYTLTINRLQEREIVRSTEAYDNFVTMEVTK